MDRVPFRVLLMFSAVVSSLGVAACGGVSDPGAIGSPSIIPEAGPPDQSAPVTGDEVAIGTGTEASTTVPETGTTVPDVSVSNPPDATVPPMDAAPEVGPPDTGRVDDAAPDVGGGGNDAGATFSCGTTMTCAFGTETCCLQATAGGGVNSTCVTGAVCPGGSTASLRCTATADCPTTGQVCCLTQGGMGAGNASQCRNVCANNNQVQLCDLMATDPGCPQLTPTCVRPAVGTLNFRLPMNVGTCQ